MDKIINIKQNISRYLFGDPLALSIQPLLVGETSVITKRLYALLVQSTGQLIAVSARDAVHDAAIVFKLGLYNVNDLLARGLGLFSNDAVAQVRPIETRDEPGRRSFM